MIDRILEFLGRWRGLPALVGVLLVILDFVFGFVPGAPWLTWHNWMLYLGIVIAVLGMLITETL